MRVYDIISKKRDNQKLTKAEIDFFVEKYSKGEIPDYQAAALLMAIYINKMDKENVRIDRLVEDIKTKLGKFATLFAYPTGHEDNFDGFCNVVDLKARKYNGVECVDDVIYDDKKVKITKLLLN